MCKNKKNYVLSWDKNLTYKPLRPLDIFSVTTFHMVGRTWSPPMDPLLELKKIFTYIGKYFSVSTFRAKIRWFGDKVMVWLVEVVIDL